MNKLKNGKVISAAIYDQETGNKVWECEKHKPTNLSHIRSLSPSELAPLLIRSSKVDDWDYDWDENPYLSGEHEEYITLDGTIFYNYNDALVHEIEWLNATHKEDNNDI